MDCSLPGCGQPAIHSWSRLAQPDESGQSPTVTQDDLDFRAVQRRAQYLLSIRELRQQREVSPTDWTARFDAMIASEQAAHDAVVPDVLQPREKMVDVVAVFACKGHDVDDETASRLHEAVCMTKVPCACYSSGAKSNLKA